ncbi:NAD(P)-dependent alcohol dehydrogenase [Paenibacillus sp. SC116]|uniref:NAD(P)-dependent alcohol dehydrogenase n=1 Tax=Paenibacillus sp. SC116 TaxID=2968986 RepID=UPI00215A0FEA|nr:NAD(P)-dependent alcohol dehydrogenase [Paenibacillus sp. SC116]MCR8842291.1 NAD(P)-dependent alcohol dehydrogenase [Paenibacillus sp. SC116]
MHIQAAIVNEKGGNITIENVQLQPPKSNEVLIKLVGTGICHTDIGVQLQHTPTPLPIALGHEGAGIIEQLGPNVTDFEVGDHVVISFSYCAKCKNCLEGHPASCDHFGEHNFGGHLLDGTSRLTKENEEIATLFGQSSFATYAVAHVNNVVKVDKDLDLSLLGPLGCGIQTGAGTVLNKLKPEIGDSIVIFGCGGVGLSGIMGAAITGAKTIIAVDIVPSRLELAKELGATHVINGKEQDAKEEIIRITGGGADYVLEATGVPALILQAIRSLRARGTMASVGVGPDVTLNILEELIMYNRTLMGVVEGDSIPKLFIPQLIEYYKQGRFPFDKLINKYKFEEINEAIADMKSGKTVKPVVIFE